MRLPEKIMNTTSKTFEGTWEEILKHADELAGHRVRVAVIDNEPNPYDPPAFDNSPEAIEAWVESFHEWVHNLPTLPTVIDDSRESIYADRLDSIL
jgi:hypothetical protein